MAERPDPDTDPNTLADDLESHVVYFERHKDDSAFVVTDTTTMLDTMRAAAVGLRQYDAITAAIGEHRRQHTDVDGEPVWPCCTDDEALWVAASLSVTPTPDRCPTCGSTNRDRVKPNDCEIIPDAWHDSGQP